MSSRAPVATVCLLFLATTFIAAQISPSNHQVSSGISGVVGKVLNADGRPAPGIHVELDDASTAVPVTSTYTQQDGTFELYNIPKGNYELVAESENSEVSDQISVQPDRSLELRFPKGTAQPDSPAAIVSVAQLLVPEKAAKMYRKALEAFHEGNYQKADRLLDSALEIDTQFAAALTLRGLMQVQGPDLQQAQQTLEQALHVDPSESAAYIALAAIYNHQGQYDQALNASQRSLAYSPKSWQAYLEMAKASIASNMYQKGLRLIRQAEKFGGSSFAEVHLVKAYALVPLKFYKEAKRELQVALSHDHSGTVAAQARNMLAQVNGMEGVTIAQAH
ncbi:MAG TPA: tetratricopeptide repeat protein [Candidatus Binatia bacterium]|nr:tetratricopeptide repeat protein [Candidatus Binatia bacterium]